MSVVRLPRPTRHTALACAAATVIAMTALVVDAAEAQAAVSSLEELRSAVNLARPGDRIELADGTYTGTPIKLSRSGTADAPITIAAAHPGGAVLQGTAGFQISGSFLTIEGFTFATSTTVSVPSAYHHIRLTGNVFQLDQSVGNWVNVSGDDCELDHNTFRHKSGPGVFLAINGPSTSEVARRTRIHHNYFLDHSFAGDNGGESIRLGTSARQHGSAQAVVEYNLFDHADGDPEAISVKSSDNIIRYNTIVDSRGTITLRHGERNRVDGNVLLRGGTGIRVFGNDHIVVNNVVQSSTGTAVQIGGGDIRDDVDSSTAHEAADRVLIAFNTLVHNTPTPIRIGASDDAYPPDSITVAENIAVGSGTAVRLAAGTNLTWQGNLLHGLVGDAMPAGGYRIADPLLATDDDGVYRLTAESPAIGAATGPHPQVATDMDGQGRASTPSIGADEYAVTGAILAPLNTGYVGAAEYVDTTAPSLSIAGSSTTAPTRGVLTVSANPADAGGVDRVEVAVRGRLVAVRRAAPWTARLRSPDAEGPVPLTVRAIDRAGNSATASRTVIVDNRAPAVRVTSAPKSGARVRGTVVIRLGATDRYGIDRVELLVNNRRVAADGTPGYAFAIRTGAYPRRMVVRVRTYDRAGNVRYSPSLVWHR